MSYEIGDIINEKYEILNKYWDKNKNHVLIDAKCLECGFIYYGTSIGFIKRKSRMPHKHRVETNWENPRIASIFAGMKQRCYNPKNKAYNFYGGKGVKICREWLNNPKLFEDWALTHGYQDNLSIDRIDSNGDYCPENCQWLTLEENMAKDRQQVFYDVDGIVKNRSEWIRYFNLKEGCLRVFEQDYGKEAVIDLFRRGLQGEDIILDHRLRGTSFEVDGETHNFSEWARILGYKSVSMLSHYYENHGEEKTKELVRSILANKYKIREMARNITVDGETHQTLEWDSILGMCRGYINKLFSNGMSEEEVINRIRKIKDGKYKYNKTRYINIDGKQYSPNYLAKNIFKKDANHKSIAKDTITKYLLNYGEEYVVENIIHPKLVERFGTPAIPNSIEVFGITMTFENWDIAIKEPIGTVQKYFFNNGFDATANFIDETMNRKNIIAFEIK